MMPSFPAVIVVSLSSRLRVRDWYFSSRHPLLVAFAAPGFYLEGYRLYIAESLIVLTILTFSLMKAL